MKSAACTAAAALLTCATTASAVNIDIASIAFGSTGPLNAEDVADTEFLLNVLFVEQAPPAAFDVNVGWPVTNSDILFMHVLGEIDVQDLITDDLREVPFLGVITLETGEVINLTGHTVGLITTQDTIVGPQPLERGVIRFDGPALVNVGGEIVQVEGMDTEFNLGIEVFPGQFTGLSRDTTGPAFGAFVPFEFSIVPEPSSVLLLMAGAGLIARRRRA